MMGYARLALAGLVLLVLAACESLGLGGKDYAYKPWAAEITQPGELRTTFEWAPAMEEALNKAGRAEEIAHIKGRYREEAWPAALKLEKQRSANPDTIRKYAVETIAQFQFKGEQMVVLRVPADKNKEMPEGWKPEQDIFFVVAEKGVAKK
jgi:hypothetical protein